LIQSIFIATTAFIYAVVLQLPGEVFGWLPNIYRKLPSWIRKPFFECQKCIAGQAGFWLFPFWTIKKIGINYDFVFHIFATTTPIFLAILITVFIDRLTGIKRNVQAKKSSFTPPELQNHDQKN
jgi:hypothetical protein